MKTLILLTTFLASLAQAETPKLPPAPKRYLQCIYSVREEIDSERLHDRLGSGDFMINFPKQPGEYVRLRLEPGVEIRLSIYDGTWLWIQLIYIATNRVIDQISAPLLPQDSPFSLSGAYGAPVQPHWPAPYPIQWGVSCWPDESTHPWPPYPGPSPEPVPSPAPLPTRLN